MIEVLGTLKALGLRISIDDFGTGHSSLSYLHRFPIDALKIDRSFVSAMTIEQSSIIQAIVALAQALRLEVIAEGIETLDQLSRLSQLGSDSGQGYLFAAALTAPDAESVLANSQDMTANPWIQPAEQDRVIDSIVVVGQFACASTSDRADLAAMRMACAGSRKRRKGKELSRD